MFLGNGAGAFTVAPGSPFAFGGSDFSVTDIEVVDFNNDGNRDVVATISTLQSGRLAALFGDGGGGLLTSPLYGAEEPFRDVEAGFVDGDSFPDLVVLGEGRAFVLFGTGTGHHQDLTLIDNLPMVAKAAIGDVNGDGLSDLAFSSRTDRHLFLAPGAAGRSFGQTVTFDVPRPYPSVSIGDLTGDGLPELVAGGFDCTVLINYGNLRFQASTGSPYNVHGGDVFPYLLVDMNRDNLLDIVAPGEGIWILLNHAPF